LNNLSKDVQLGKTVPMVFADPKAGQEALILDHMSQYGWRDAINKKDGLDLNHVTKVIEWIATFHGLSYVLLQKHSEGPEGWLRANPWAVPLSQRPPEGLKVGLHAPLLTKVFLAKVSI
jgi:hypothetical protein